jgi:hypothetical protein
MKRSAEMPGSGGDDSVVVVSGASGLVGRALVAELLRRGHAVRRLVRRPVRFEDERRWDPTTGTLDADALRGARAVVHLAGAGIGDQRWTPARRVEIRESRVQGTSTLARAMVTMRDPPVWVSGSAIGIYGDRGNEELDETSAAGAGFLADVCQEWEAATAPVTASGGRVVLLRTGVVLARQGGALARQLPLFRLGLGGKLGHGQQWVSWIALADEVGAILHAVDHDDLSGPVNATAPNPVTNAELTSALGRALHRPTRIAAPRRLLEVALGGQLTDEALLASQRALPRRLEASGYRFAYPEITGAIAAALAD